ncbi:MAG: endonuclease [Duncaniella sp.]|nr:endonuclease [Duncaniella sp.]
MRNFLRQLVLVAIGAGFWLAGSAAIPAGYYSSLKGKSGAELKTAVFQVINPHTTVSSYSNLPQYFQKTDVYPSSKQWWDMYSNVKRYAPSFSGLNREHAFPKSWWKQNGSVEYTPAYIDLNHLYPADGPANQAKSNYPLGVTGSNPKFDNGVSRIGYPVSGQGGGAQYVFEPADEYKGDFARAYFYVVTCYQNLTWNSTWMLQQNTYPTLAPWAVDLLLKWHRADPVDQKETNRNEVVYSYQNNRNPFIDFPDLAEYIWGNKLGESFDPGSSSEPGGDPILINPVNNTALDFAEVAVGSITTALLYLKGESLSGNVSLRISGTDRNMFTLDPAAESPKLSASIPASLVNAAGGYQLQVSYKPTAVGEHSAKISIYDGGTVGTTTVNLLGQALEVPTLSRLTAYDPSDITATSYKASWSEAPEVVDYYLLTRIRTINGNMVEEKIECDENYTVIDDYDPSVSEAYYVQSSRLGYLSEPSETKFVSQSGISNVETDNPFSVESYPGCVRFRCAGVHTDVCIYDMTGRLVMSISEITDGHEITLPYGIYLVRSAQHPAAVRIIAR